MDFPYNVQEFLNCDLTGFVLLDANQINKKQDENFYKICRMINVFCAHPLLFYFYYCVKASINCKHLRKFHGNPPLIKLSNFLILTS